MSDAFMRRENLFRVNPSGLELRAAEDGGLPTMFGHFAVFNEWTEIRSRVEGRFLERIAAGAFAKTFSENRARMKVLFQHGQDPQVGDKPLGPIQKLEEDDLGAYYEVPLLDTAYNREILPGLEAGLYGASFRFTVLQEDFDRRPARSAHNPDGIPERTVREVRVPEFGPVTFPAYVGASSGVRSITDDMLLARLAEDEERGHATASLAGIRIVNEDAEARAERRYTHVVETMSATPWAITPDALQTVVGILTERAAGHRLTDDEIRERIGTVEERAAATTPDGPVAVLGLYGPIVPRADMFTEVSGLASVQTFQKAFRAAIASADVKSILIDIDSPGGDVSLVPELAAEILAARGEKPIYAVANTLAASAAYWIGSMVDKLYVTPSGEVGSIGVYSAHQDISAAQKKLGVKTTLVSAGKFKVERSPFEPLSDEAEAAMQQKVVAYYEMFLAAVADGRGVTVETVRNEFGEGRTVMAANAVDAGMADIVGTYDDALAELLEMAAGDADEEPDPDEDTTPEQDPEDDSEPEPSEATTPAASYLLVRANDDSEEEPSWHL